MAITNFIPTVWSQALYEELQKNYVGVKLSSREFEGEIKNQGDRVKINGIGPVSVFDYVKNTDMPAPEVLSDNTRTLVIDQAKGFNFFIDDIDDIQSSPNLIKAAMKRAADALSDEADKYIYTLDDSKAFHYSNGYLQPDNVIENLSQIRRILLERNVPNSARITLEVPPSVEQVLITAKLLTDTNNSEALAKGYVGKILGFDIYVTNNIKLNEGIGAYRCVARTQRAIAFAEQINAIKPYEPELRNGTAVKGLHLYGAKIVYPQEVLFADFIIEADL